MRITSHQLFLLFIVVSTPARALEIPPTGLADSPWPDYGGGLANTHRTTAIGPSGNVRILWEYKVPEVPGSFNQPFRQPVLGADGTIYFGTFTNSQGQLTALSPDGTPKWVQIGNAIGFWQAVSADGTIYHEGYLRHTGRGPLYARSLDDGNIDWTSSSASGPFESGPTIGPDGTVYSVVGGLTAFTPDGSLLWQFEQPESQYRNPAISEDGTILLGGDNEVLAINPNGTLKWAYATGVRIGPISIADDGNIYVGTVNTSNQKIFSLTSDGAERWIRSGVSGTPSIGLDGTIYAGYRGTLHAIDPNTGNDIWTYPTGFLDEFGVEGITVDGRGNLYMGTRDGIIMSLTSNGQLRWQIDIAPHLSGVVLPAAPVIGKNGVVYVAGGTTNSFFAIGVPEPSSIALVTVATLAFLIGYRRRIRWF